MIPARTMLPALQPMPLPCRRVQPRRGVAIVLGTALGLACANAALGYESVAQVTFTFGGSSSAAFGDPYSALGSAPGGAGMDIGWSSNGSNHLDVWPTNATYFSNQSGFNSRSYYNSAYAGTDADCDLALGSVGAAARKYGCRYGAAFYNLPEGAEAAASSGPVGQASGTLTVTDTTLTGTLTLINTSDEPTGGTTSLAWSSDGTYVTRLGTSTGNGVAGYNYRTADGSPFGNAWYGVTTSMTLTVNLTGTFTATSWQIDGGAVTAHDANFQCQQGGFGGDNRGILCARASVGGGFDPNGGHLSWGMDPDGGATGVTVASPIVVKDGSGSYVITTLSGVLASLVVDGSGNLSTTSGEFRRAFGAAGTACTNHIRYDGPNFNCGTLAVGRLAITGTVGPPPPFASGAFVDQQGVPVSSVVRSNIVSVTGVGTAAAVSVTGGEYSINCIAGDFTSAPGAISDGQTVCVRHTSAAAHLATADTTLTIGAISDTFTSTTEAEDTTPDGYTFTDLANVPVGVVQASNALVITGINAPTPVSVTSGEYSVAGGPFTSAPGTITNGQSLVLRHTTAGTYSTLTSTMVTIGGMSDIWNTTTVPPPDSVPNPFVFIDVADVYPGQVQYSNAIAITGINTPTALSVSGGEYSVNGGAFGNAPGTVQNGDQVVVRHTSAATSLTAVDTTLSVGGVSDTFTTTTIQIDNSPDPFDFFVDVADAEPGATQVSNSVLIGGINLPTPISVSGGEYSVNGGTFTAAPGTVQAGVQLRLRHTSAAAYTTATTTTVTVGDASATFTSTTRPDPALATVVTYFIGGNMAASVNQCFNIAVSLTNRDCSYAKTRVATTTQWRGPIDSSAFYAIGSAGDDINHLPVPGDGKLALPLWGQVVIDDYGTPANGSDDRISASWIFGAAAYNAQAGNGDRAVERWTSWAHTMAPTRVTSATPQPGGGFRYLIGSRGAPTPAPLFILGNASDTFPSENAQGTLSSPPVWDATVMDGEPVANRVGIERSRGFADAGGGFYVPNVGATTTATFTHYSCEDNPGDTDCVNATNDPTKTTSAVLFGPNRNGGGEGYPHWSAPYDGSAYNRVSGDPDAVPLSPGFSNVILILTTDGAGEIIGAEAYWTREYIIANGPAIADDDDVGGLGSYLTNNSWQGGRFSFTGVAGQDGDLDGAGDQVDNCTVLANADQRDTDGDGYGNRCDGDFDNNGFVNYVDLASFRQRFGSPDPGGDLDGNGIVNFTDLAYFRALFGKSPGPSAIAP